MASIPDEDYYNRIHRLQVKMRERNLDAVLCYADSGVYENVSYLTRYWPLFEVGGVLVGKEGKPLVLIGGEAPEFGGQTPFGMESVRACTAFGHTSGPSGDWVGVKYYSLEDLFKEITSGKGVNRIGLGDYSTTPHPLYEKVAKAVLPSGSIVDASDLLIDLRMHKSSYEVEMVREACKLSERAFDNVLGRITPEMTEYELEGLLAAELYKDGGEGPSFPILCYSGYRSRSGIGRSTHNKLGRETLINIDIGCHYGGYASAFGRPIYFGKMPDSMKKEIDFMIDLHDRLINEWIVPGVTSGSIYKRYYDWFISHGFGAPPASASHGIGVFEGEPPTFRPNHDTVLTPGMTVSGDHFFRSKNYGFRFEDCYTITKTGTELFTKGYWTYIEL